jgi:hypothetical protein
LTDLVNELIEAAEKNRVKEFLERCAQAGLTAKLTKEIENDARFPATAKVLLKHAIPRLGAKWLNKAGISAEYQDEISVVTALILIVRNNAQVNARFDEIIEEQKKLKASAPAPAPSLTKPPPTPSPKPAPAPSANQTVEVKI